MTFSKLTLNKETLRTLNEDQAGTLLGGMKEVSISKCGDFCTTYNNNMCFSIAGWTGC